MEDRKWIQQGCFVSRVVKSIASWTLIQCYSTITPFLNPRGITATLKQQFWNKWLQWSILITVNHKNKCAKG